MKPKLKQTVHFAPTEDGVYFKTWTGEFAIKGKGLYQWIEQMAPYLDGNKTIEELVEPLSHEQAQFVRQLISQLDQRGVIKDATDESHVILSDQEKELYQQTILYLEEYASDGRKQFQEFRHSQWMVIGSGLSYRSCVRSVVSLGVKTLYLEATEDTTLIHWIEKWQKKDPELKVTWISSEGEEACAYQNLDLAIYVSDRYDFERIASLIQLLGKHEVDFLIATCIENRGIVGPVITKEAPTSWYSLRDRLHQKQEAALSLPPTFYLMLGNLAALEAFKFTNELPDQGVVDGVVILTPDQLETKRHPLLLSPFFNKEERVDEKEWLRRFQTKSEEEDQEVFLEQIAEISDPQLGIIHPVHPGDLWQIPLLFMGATLHFPRSMNRESKQFVVGKETVSDATEQVIRDALTFYAQAIHEHEGDEDLPATSYVWENGRTFAEWQGRGALKAWSQMVKQSAQAKVLPLEISSLKIGSYVKMLSLRYGCNIRLIEVDLGLPSSYYVQVLDGCNILAESVGRTQAEAVEAALVQGISQMQLKNHHPDLCDPLEPSWISDGTLEAGEWENERPVPSWQEWKAVAEVHWQEKGWELIIKPWYRDPACFEAGLLIGRIGFKEGGGVE